MQYINYFLIFLAVFPIISHQGQNVQASCPGLHENSVFVNAEGKDSLTCGTHERPCLTISYAVRRAVEENFTSVLVNISWGIYKETESIKLDCSRWNLQRISLWGERCLQAETQLTLLFPSQNQQTLPRFFSTFDIGHVAKI